MMLDGDSEDWWERASDLPPEQVNAFNIRSSNNEHLLDRTLLAAGATWPGINAWDDVRTLDYFYTGTRWIETVLVAWGSRLEACGR